MRILSRTRRPVAQIEGEEYRFHAPSDTLGQPPWLVDIESHNGDGECGCPDWDLNKRVLRKQGERNLDKIQCKHLVRALVVWAIKENPELYAKPKQEVLAWARKELKRRIREKRRLMKKKL